ncbi:hypothetical protein DFH94DRAFT_708813 [Russula ochroleuca]|uniref:Uncharacterized protein n=1 Tax=Russula ochroleuca TaxID=152965 RepID=A0A9P5N3T3_9AGAM|nr:hypothetical protein DFH94DRAFT_708813 [Russula ochroleuca]
MRINQRLQTMEDLLPMRLYNSSISMDDPLRYPPAINIVEPFPNTKNELNELTIAHCAVVAGALGLPQVPPGTTVVECRKQISNFLGCAM